MKRKLQRQIKEIKTQDLYEATQTAIAAVREKVKETGMGFAMDCCLCSIDIPGYDTIGLIDEILLGGTGQRGPHFQKYYLNYTAVSTFCKVLTDKGYVASFYCNID